MAVNRIVLVGNLGRNPQVFGPSDDDSHKSITRLSVATERGYRDRDGEHRKVTDWHPVVCFGRLADLAGELKKGDPVAVEGHGRTHTYERDGETRYDYQVVAVRITPPSRFVLGPDRDRATANDDDGPTDGDR